MALSSRQTQASVILVGSADAAQLVLANSEFAESIRLSTQGLN